MWIEGNLYKLSNGNILRVCNMCDDPECEYGYDYFDCKTLKLIDGGMFNIDEPTEDIGVIVREAISWCSLDPDEIKWDLIMEDIGYGELEDLGYSGF